MKFIVTYNTNDLYYCIKISFFFFLILDYVKINMYSYQCANDKNNFKEG